MLKDAGGAGAGNQGRWERAAASTIPIRNTASRALVARSRSLAYAGPAQANGDPASHALPGEDVYLPRQSEPSGPVTTALELLLKRTEEAGYPLRVALIATPADLGTSRSTSSGRRTTRSTCA